MLVSKSASQFGDISSFIDNFKPPTTPVVLGRDESLQRRSNRSLRATGIREKTRAKNRGMVRISSVEERNETATVGKRS